MPANLPPNYLAAEQRFRAARTNTDKLAALNDMYAAIPKHKGTEKLRADIKRRISKLRAKEKQPDKISCHIEKQGLGMVLLIGLANSGRSMLFSRLTLCEPDIDNLSYTTKMPCSAMMVCEREAIQLVDTPPMFRENTCDWLSSLAINADIIAIVLDASDNALLDEIEDIREEMAKSGIMLGASKPAIIIANKIDLPDAADNLKVLNETYSGEFDIYSVSALNGDGLEQLRCGIYNRINTVELHE